MSGAVGEDGVVYAHNRNDQGHANRLPDLEKQYPRYGNIELILAGEYERIPLADNSVDFVLFALQIHHYHYDETNPTMIPARAESLYREVKRILKPGGTFAVIDHRAIDGASRLDGASWHRIDRETAVKDITGSGFSLVSENTCLHSNPNDDMAHNWRGGKLARGETSRLLLKFTNSK